MTSIYFDLSIYLSIKRHPCPVFLPPKLAATSSPSSAQRSRREQPPGVCSESSPSPMARRREQALPSLGSTGADFVYQPVVGGIVGRARKDDSLECQFGSTPETVALAAEVQELMDQSSDAMEQAESVVRRSRRALTTRHVSFNARRQAKLTRTPRGLRAVRTGYAYQLSACCTYQRRRAACPEAPSTVRTPHASSLGWDCTTVRTAYLGTTGNRVASSGWRRRPGRRAPSATESSSSSTASRQP